MTHRAGRSRLSIRLVLQAVEAAGQGGDEWWLCPEEVHLLMAAGTGTKGQQAKLVCGPPSPGVKAPPGGAPGRGKEVGREGDESW